MRFLLLILISSALFAPEDTTKPLPKDVQTIVDSREKALQEARIAYDKAVFKANEDAVKKMESVVKTSTQKGDLDGALASKKFVEDWNKEKEAVTVTGALGGGGPGEKKNDLAKMIVGKWNIKINAREMVWNFNVNKTVDNGVSIGNYEIKNNLIFIDFGKGNVVELTKINENNFTGKDRNNTVVNGSKNQ